MNLIYILLGDEDFKASNIDFARKVPFARKVQDLHESL